MAARFVQPVYDGDPTEVVEVREHADGRVDLEVRTAAGVASVVEATSLSKL